VRDDLDRRQVNVELTPKGSALYPQIMEIIMRVYGRSWMASRPRKRRNCRCCSSACSLIAVRPRERPPPLSA
jgi:DNA-binding MarR family transcriptional regulator